MKKQKILSLIVTFTVFCNLFVFSQFYKSGTINSAESWQITSPRTVPDYIIDGNLTISSTGSVGIDQNVIIWVDPTYSITVNGNITTSGDPANPVIFTESTNGYGWGGIYFNNGSSSMSDLNGCIIEKSNNTGITVNSSSQLTIFQSIIRYNTGSNAGGIYCYNGSNIQIYYCNIVNNVSGNNGGGISIINSSPDIQSSCIHFNTGNYGGGVYCNTTGSPVFHYQDTISDNTASDKGGGLYLSDCTPEITQTVIQSNSAGNYGGGIFFSDGTINIHDDVFLKNNICTNGAGLYSEYSDGTISATDINHNIASQDGGGLFLINGHVTIQNSIIKYNHASNFGGGIKSYDMYYVAITSDSVKYNSSTYRGGAIYDHSSNTQISYSTFQFDSSIYGGAIYTDYSSLSVTQSHIINNAATYFPNTLIGGFGGGINLNHSGASITNNQIESNWADWSGGGIFGDYLSYSDINLNVIKSNLCNDADYGGYGAGICLIHSNYFNIINNLIIDNISLEDGGGIEMEVSDNFTVNSNTIADNSCSDPNAQGGGIYCDQANGVYCNNIVYNNSAVNPYENLSQVYWNGWWQNPLFHNSDIQGTSFLFPSNNNIPDDPQFHGIGNYHLINYDPPSFPKSPCIDQGSNSYTYTTYDLDGQARIMTGATANVIDMGCYEHTYMTYKLMPNDTFLDQINCNIYPNPCTSYINISISSETSNNLTIVLFDLNNKVVYNSTYLNQKGNDIKKIDVSNLSKGIYLLSIHEDSKNIFHSKINIF